MMEDETIEEMFEQLGRITHELDLMGVIYEHEKIVCKVLKNLVAPWKIKATTIEESRKIVTMTTNELKGKLIAYEKTYLKMKVEESSSQDEPMDDKEMTLLSRRMFKFYKKRYRNNINKGYSRQNKEVVTCYECKKPGHVRVEFPQLNKGKKDRKNPLANVSWSNDDLLESGPDSEEPKIVNICLMANSDSEEDADEVSDLPISYDELSHAFNTLVEDLKKVLQMHHDLRTTYLKLLKNFKAIINEKNYLEAKIKHIEEEQYLPLLIAENKGQKAKNDCLTYDLSRFIQGQENLNIMLGNQKRSLDKASLGYNQENIIQYVAKQERSSIGVKTCYACGRKGHILSMC